MDEVRFYLVFSKARNPFKRLFGKLIQWIDGVPFTHASILVEYGKDRIMFESVIPKSQKLFTFEWRKHYSAELCYRLPDVNDNLAIKSLEGMLGIEYSFFQLILIALARLFAKFQKYFGNNINGKKRLICSELVAEFLKEVYGVQFNENIDFVSLKDIWICGMELSKKRWDQ